MEWLIGLPLVASALLFLASLACLYGYWQTRKRAWLLTAATALALSVCIFMLA